MFKKDEMDSVIGKNIKFYRESYNLGKTRKERISQEKLAELADLSPSMIGNMESDNGKQGIGTYNLYKISLILNVRIDKFFEPRD